MDENAKPVKNTINMRVTTGKIKDNLKVGYIA